MPAPAPLRGWVRQMTEWELRRRGSTREGHTASVGQQSCQRLRSCDSCQHSGGEDWPQKKTALLCLRPGQYRGSRRPPFHNEHKGVIYGSAAPAWCEGYEPGE